MEAKACFAFCKWLNYTISFSKSYLREVKDRKTKIFPYIRANKNIVKRMKSAFVSLVHFCIKSRATVTWAFSFSPAEGWLPLSLGFSVFLWVLLPLHTSLGPREEWLLCLPACLHIASIAPFSQLFRSANCCCTT